MTYIVEPTQSGTMTGAGDILVPIAGEHDLWDAIWAAPPYWGSTTGSTPNLGTSTAYSSMSLYGTHSMKVSRPLAVTMGAGGRAEVATVPTVTDYTSVWVLDVRTGPQELLTLPGVVVDAHLGDMRLWHGAGMGVGMPATGKHVWAFVRRGGAWEVWCDGALRASATAGRTTNTMIALNRTGKVQDVDFYECRFVARALTPAQIVAASQDLALIHGV